jgi:transcription antitermination factor NusG
MTERPVEISPAEHELFLSLQDQFTDPLRERLETEGRAYAELFNTLPEAVQRKTVLMQELDAQWPYMNKPVTVSGYVLVRDDANDGGFEWHAVRNLPMISKVHKMSRDILHPMQATKVSKMRRNSLPRTMVAYSLILSVL